MRCDVTDDVEAFLDAASGFLQSRPVEHNLVLSLAEQARGDRSEPSRWAWATDRSGRVVGALIQAPAGYTATVTPMSDDAVDVLVDRLGDVAADMPGVNGEAATVSRLAGQWASARRTPARPIAAERLYRLGILDRPGSVAGGLRRATASDEATLVAWDNAFAAETGLIRPAGADRAAVIAQRVAAGEWWVWATAAGSMSMAYSTPPLAGAARIGAVYTPPEHRAHGYASAMVAALSANLLGAGVRECLLYAQLVNPVSNRVYQRLGYEPVAEILAYRFG